MAGYSHLSLRKRNKIKKMLNEGYSKSDIAKSVGVSCPTIYHEINRGLVNGEYDPKYSHERYIKNLSRKRNGSFFEKNIEAALYVSNLILEEGCSPKQVIKLHQSNKEFDEFPSSVNTIYGAIKKGLIPGVTMENIRSQTTVMNYDIVHIAKWVQEEIGWNNGDKLHFEIDHDKLIFTKIKN